MTDQLKIYIHEVGYARQSSGVHGTFRFSLQCNQRDTSHAQCADFRERFSKRYDAILWTVGETDLGLVKQVHFTYADTFHDEVNAGLALHRLAGEIRTLLEYVIEHHSVPVDLTGEIRSIMQGL